MKHYFADNVVYSVFWKQKVTFNSWETWNRPWHLGAKPFCQWQLMHFSCINKTAIHAWAWEPRGNVQCHVPVQLVPACYEGIGRMSQDPLRLGLGFWTRLGGILAQLQLLHTCNLKIVIALVKDLKQLWINSAMKLDSLASWLKYNTNSECYAGVDGWEMQ